MVVTIISIWHHREYRFNQTLMQFCLFLDIGLTLAMFGFCIWNWGLAFYGSTSIEFWGDFAERNDPKRAKLRFDTINDNLFRIFGTHNLFRILSPSLRNVPFTGLEWSFMLQDDGYDSTGKKLEIVDSENQEQPYRVSELEEEEEIEMQTILIKPKSKQQE